MPLQEIFLSRVIVGGVETTTHIQYNDTNDLITALIMRGPALTRAACGFRAPGFSQGVGNQNQSELRVQLASEGFFMIDNGDGGLKFPPGVGTKLEMVKA